MQLRALGYGSGATDATSGKSTRTQNHEHQIELILVEGQSSKLTCL